MFSNKIYIYFVAFVASLGGFQFGYEVGILESIKTIDSFKKEFFEGELNDDDDDVYYSRFEITNESETDTNINFQIAFCIGCMIGALIVPYIGDFFGRKRSVLVGASIFGLGSLIAGITFNKNLFYAARVIIGIGIGILSTICPLYIAETAPIKIRGRLLSIYQLMITFGIFVAHIAKIIIERFLKNDPGVQWRVTLGMQVVPGILLLVMMFFLPYSPRYLIWQEREDDALRVIAKLRGVTTTHDTEIQNEYQKMKKGLEIERHECSTGWTELLKFPILKRVAIAVFLQAFQQFTGINVILYNQIDIISESIIKDEIITILALVNALINVIGTIPALFLVDKIGRRKTLIFGCIAMIVGYMGCSAFNYDLGIYQNKTIVIVAKLIFMYIFVFSFAFSWGPTVWAYQSEIFPMRIRSKGTSLASLSNWLNFSIIARITPVLFEKLNNKLYIVYLVFALNCFLALLFTIFFVPETKDLSLEEIDTLFENKDKSKQK